MNLLHYASTLCAAALLAACDGSDSPAAPSVGAAPATAQRLTIENRCGDDVWVVETPPGATAAVQAQWDWFRKSARYTVKEKAQPNGGIVAALLLTKGQSQVFDVPDRGAPGGNLRFYMGCPNASTADPGGDPFDVVSGCIIGAAAGDRAGINTLFEPTFGCRPGLSGKDCAFNPGDPSSACQTNPGSDACAPLGTGDNFDISAVDGYTLPVKVEAAGPDSAACNRLVTDAGMLDLASCPTEDATTLYSDVPAQQNLIAGGIGLLTQDASAPSRPLLRACTAPYKWFQTDTLGTPTSPQRLSGECDPANSTFGSHCYYAGAGCDANDRTYRCPSGSGPQQKVGPTRDGRFAIQNTRWVQQLYGLGYQGYTWQYGDGVGDQACPSTSSYKLTLCPAGGVPYRGGQLWSHSTASGACGTDGSTGTPDGTTTFGSLVACQQARMRYTCSDLTASDPYRVPVAMWAADAAATLAGSGLAYAQIAPLRRRVCADVTLDVAGQGRLTLPQCNDVYTPSGAAGTCPAGSTARR